MLAPIAATDVEALAVLHADPLVAHWTGPWTPATNARWTQEMVERWATDGVGKWLVRDRRDGSLVGRGGFSLIDPDSLIDLDGHRVLELGWTVRDRLTGRGYATEVGRAALAWADVHEPGRAVVAFTEVHNLASQAVMRRLGLRPVGVIQRQGLIEGRSGLHANAPFALYRRDPEG